MISKMFHASTGHVSKETRDWLNTQGRLACEVETMSDAWPEIHIAKHTYGWWMYCGDDDSDLHKDWPKDLCAVMIYAKKKGCDYLLLDCDATIIDSIPTFNW